MYAHQRIKVYTVQCSRVDMERYMERKNWSLLQELSGRYSFDIHVHTRVRVFLPMSVILNYILQQFGVSYLVVWALFGKIIHHINENRRYDRSTIHVCDWKVKGTSLRPSHLCTDTGTLTWVHGQVSLTLSLLFPICNCSLHRHRYGHGWN